MQELVAGKLNNELLCDVNERLGTGWTVASVTMSAAPVAVDGSSYHHKEEPQAFIAIVLEKAAPAVIRTRPS